MSDMKLALVSVYNKDRLDFLGEQLMEHGYTILSSGGTARELKKCMGVDASRIMEIDEYTGFPESPDGLVKTLQGKIHAGLLMDPRNPEHRKYMMKIGAFPINFVAVNLYPFEETIQREGISKEEAAEQIDIGGPTMLRSAAKGLILNQRPVVVCNPEDYAFGLRALDMLDDGGMGNVIYMQFVRKVFEYTAGYERAIDDFLREKSEE